MMLESSPPLTVGADRHVRAQVQRDRLLDAARAPRSSNYARCGRSRARSAPPSSARPHAVRCRTVSTCARAAARGRRGTASCRPGRTGRRGSPSAPSRSISIAGRNGSSAFTSEAQIEHAVDRRVVERLDAEPVAGAEERLLALVPEREGEHAAQALDAGVAPLPVRAQDRPRCPRSSGTRPRRSRAAARGSCRSRRCR